MSGSSILQLLRNLIVIFLDFCSSCSLFILSGLIPIRNLYSSVVWAVTWKVILRDGSFSSLLLLLLLSLSLLLLLLLLEPSSESSESSFLDSWESESNVVGRRLEVLFDLVNDEIGI